MRILIGMPSKDSWGGPISSEPPFVDALRELGHDVTEEIYVYGDKEKPTPIYERFRRVFSTAKRFRKILKEGSFNIIHLNTAFDMRTLLRDTFSIWYMRPGTAKIFFKLHGSEANKFFQASVLQKRLMRFLNQNVNGFGVHTSEEKESLLRLGFDESKFYFCKNTVTLSDRMPKNYRRRHREATETFQLLFASRFIKEKGLLETIEACAILKGSGVNFVLYCLGDGSIKAEAEKLVLNLGFEKNVQFTGYISESEVERYLLDTDIFIFPTKHAEGFPNILFKAIAAGMPVVSTAFRTAVDYLKKDENYVCCEFSKESIYQKVSELINDKPLREKMSRNNLDYGKTLLPESIAKEFVTIYEKILK